MRAAAKVSAAISFVMALLVAWYVVDLYRTGPRHLVACYDSEPGLSGWSCKQVLVHWQWRTDDVAEMNGGAGVLYAVLVENPAAAKEMLSLFIEKGVDINARNERASQMTALHTMVMAGDVPRIQLLLAHGAKVEVTNAKGQSSLDIARLLSARAPADANRAEIVRLLEAKQAG